MVDWMDLLAPRSMNIVVAPMQQMYYCYRENKSPATIICCHSSDTWKSLDGSTFLQDMPCMWQQWRLIWFLQGIVRIWLLLLRHRTPQDTVCTDWFFRYLDGSTFLQDMPCMWQQWRLIWFLQGIVRIWLLLLRHRTPQDTVCTDWFFR